MKAVGQPDSQIVFRSHPLRTVPRLDSDPTNPVYFCSHHSGIQEVIERLRRESLERMGNQIEEAYWGPHA